MRIYINLVNIQRLIPSVAGTTWCVPSNFDIRCILPHHNKHYHKYTTDTTISSIVHEHFARLRLHRTCGAQARVNKNEVCDGPARTLRVM